MKLGLCSYETAYVVLTEKGLLGIANATQDKLRNDKVHEQFKIV